MRIKPILCKCSFTKKNIGIPTCLIKIKTILRVRKEGMFLNCHSEGAMPKVCVEGGSTSPLRKA